MVGRTTDVDIFFLVPGGPLTSFCPNDKKWFDVTEGAESMCIFTPHPILMDAIFILTFFCSFFTQTILTFS